MLRSPLAPPDKVRYLRDALFDRPSSSYCLAGGGAVRLRPGTTDRKVFDEVLIDRVYAPALSPLPRGLLTIVDLGANIGLSTIALLREFPLARAVAVEPDPGNFQLLEENLRAAGLEDRCCTIQGFVGAAAGFAELVDSGNGAWGMRMGARTAGGIPVMTLAEIAEVAGMSEVALLKCDIEGAERELFAGIRGWDALVRYVVLELHADLFPAAVFEASLEDSAFEWTIHGLISDRSPLSVLGLERGAPHSTVRAAAAHRGFQPL